MFYVHSLCLLLNSQISSLALCSETLIVHVLAWIQQFRNTNGAASL
jgi:hypothetical protein